MIDASAGGPGVYITGGDAIITTPYDWSDAATPLEQWLGGHSQRGGVQGDSAAMLRSLLTPGGHPQSVQGLPGKTRRHQVGA